MNKGTVPPHDLTIVDSSHFVAALGNCSGGTLFADHATVTTAVCLKVCHIQDYSYQLIVALREARAQTVVRIDIVQSIRSRGHEIG